MNFRGNPYVVSLIASLSLHLVPVPIKRELETLSKLMFRAFLASRHVCVCECVYAKYVPVLVRVRNVTPTSLKFCNSERAKVPKISSVLAATATTYIICPNQFNEGMMDVGDFLLLYLRPRFHSKQDFDNVLIKLVNFSFWGNSLHPQFILVDNCINYRLIFTWNYIFQPDRCTTTN